MAKCEHCQGTNRATAWVTDANGRRYPVTIPCPHCALGDVSCCDGPIGEPDQEPTDPNASRPEQSTPPLPSYEGGRLKRSGST